jgi:poly(3-hydroxybutyrate) depolymerase
MQPGVGHYGVFNGSRFRSEIAPRIGDFVLSNNGEAGGGNLRAALNAAAPSAKSNGAIAAAAPDSSTSADAAELSAVNE